MIPLIDKRDKDILDSTSFPQNAMFYKDMVAFCDAYTKFLSIEREMLPNYCFIDGKLYLDGLCLMIKDYCFEFDFETLDLTMDYLKTLYYAIASLSTDGYFPDKTILEKQVEEIKKKDSELLSKAVSLTENAKLIYDDCEKSYNNQVLANKKVEKKKKHLSIFLLVSLFIELTLIAVTLLLGKSNSMKMTLAYILSVLIFVLMLVFQILFLVKTKKCKIKLKENESKTILLEEQKNSKFSNYKNILEKKTKINSEVCNFIYCINSIDLLNDNINYRQLLETATEFNMLSYNIEYDVANTFDSHREDILKVVKEISELKSNVELSINLKNIYKKILEKSWLYHDRFVRYSFLEKFISSARTTHNWQIFDSGEYIDPFDIDVKSIAEQEVAFLPNENSLFVKMPLSRLMSIDLVKKDEQLKIKNDFTYEQIRDSKIYFASKFYNIDELSKYDGIFCSEKGDKNKGLNFEKFEGNNVLPDLLLMNFKLIEAKNNFENSHSEIIAKIMKDIEQAKANWSDEDDTTMLETDDEFDDFNFADEEDFVCDNIEERDDGTVIYYYQGKKIIGYKL